MAEGTRNSCFIYFISDVSEGRGQSFAAAACRMEAAELALGHRGSPGVRNRRDVLGHLFSKAVLLWVFWHKRIVNGAV